MSISTPFIHRPVGTTLLTLAILLAGILGYRLLPVSPLPQVDSPTISVGASLPGASPETMASAVATPLERQFGRIASVTEMSSSSTLGSTGITIQFDLSRDIDAAGRDVQAAINAARSQLPTDLPGNPTYRKVNPADAPIMILAITSDTYSKGAMYDAASSVLAQKLSQVQGVGQVFVGGGALPGVRVEVNPTSLAAVGLSLEDLRTFLQNANSNTPKGSLSSGVRHWLVGATDQLYKAADYQSLIVATHNGVPIRLSDVAQVRDSTEDIRTLGLADAKPAVLVVIFRQPGANIIDAVDRVKLLMPILQAEIPSAMRLKIAMDRTTTIRASITDTERTLIISVCLVVLVVFLFLRDWRSTFIPSVAVPVSLVGTFGVMYLCNYSVDNLSLMALTIATGFVVDDAIVVIENITRHLEAGMKPLAAALQGAREIGFTVISMSASLVAVFIPILLMNGQIGRLFREFAVVLSVAIAISMVISLTTTPMLCAILLQSKEDQRHGWLYRFSESIFDGILAIYRVTLGAALRHPLVMLMATLGTVCVTVVLFYSVGFGNLFPSQDTGRLTGNIQADQHTSFQAMTSLVQKFSEVVSKDKDVDTVIAFAGGGRGTVNTANMFVSLKPLGVRTDTADQVVNRLRGRTAAVTGGQLFLNPVQDLRVGGRSSNATYQYTLQGDSLAELTAWAPKVLSGVRKLPGLADVNMDQQNLGLEANLTVDRDSASRLGVDMQALDNILNDAFGQRQVSTMYTPLNQYHTVMEVAPDFWQSAQGLEYIYVPTTSGGLVKLSAFASYNPATTNLSVNHTGQFPSVTISFNLLPGFSLSDAVSEIDKAELDMGVPNSIHGSFQGTAQAYLDARSGMGWLIAAALITVYLVLGMLYESLIHPITILSTLPSAGVGALLALNIFHTQLDVIGVIGIILLIGIVKKNAIMMIDFALETERSQHITAIEAVYQACLLRFRPIMMTTMAAMLGALPLVLSHGTGSELRRPLGLVIVGGLVFSQALTLYTTPVIYIYMDRLRLGLKWLINPDGVSKPLAA